MKPKFEPCNGNLMVSPAELEASMHGISIESPTDSLMKLQLLDGNGNATNRYAVAPKRYLLSFYIGQEQYWMIDSKNVLAYFSLP